jgi:hypothetical protein
MTDLVNTDKKTLDSTIGNNQEDYVDVEDLLRVLKSKNKPQVKTKFALHDIKNNPKHLEKAQANNVYYKEESERVREAPRVSLADMIEANQSDAQIMLATLKNKNKEFIDEVLQ